MPRTRNYRRRRKASAEQMVDHNHKGYGVYFLPEELPLICNCSPGHDFPGAQV